MKRMGKIQMEAKQRWDLAGLGHSRVCVEEL